MRVAVTSVTVGLILAIVGSWIRIRGTDLHLRVSVPYDIYTEWPRERDLRYVRDTRVGFCFAAYYEPWSSGGPAFSKVPCDSVKTLLTDMPK